MNRKCSNYLILFMSFGLLSSIIIPPIKLGTISVYLVTFFSLILVMMAVPLVTFKGRINKSSLFVLMLGFVVIISASYSVYIGFTELNARDYIESIKYFQFAPFLLLMTYLNLHERSVNRLIYASALFFIFVGIVQVLTIPVLNDFFLLSYLGNDSIHFESAASGHRISLTGSDPNVGAVIGYFFALYFLFSSIYEKNKKLLILFFVCIFLCLLTQSRTALVGFLFSILTYLMFFSRINFLYKISGVFLVVTFFFMMVYALDLQYIILGFIYAVEGDNNSLNVRIQNFYDALELLSYSPWFGVGSAKSTLSTIIDSEYALIMQRYGFVGVGVFCVYIFHLLFLAKKVIYSKWGAILLAFILMSMVVMLTNNVFSGYQVMSIVVLLNIVCYLKYKEFNLQRIRYASS